MSTFIPQRYHATIMGAYAFTNFFDISSFNFQQLFVGTNAVWEALDRLQPFLNSYSFELRSFEQEGVFLENANQIQIHPSAKIERGAYLEGPCIVEAHATIRTGAVIYPYSIISSHAVVGHCSEIKRSILFPHAKAPHFNYVGDSILGNEVNLGAGFICANFRLDKQKIFIERTIDTKRNKLGAIIGDRSSLGCNGVSNPGTILKKESKSYPCQNVRGNVCLQ